jgi:hypothetical protein
MQNIPVKYPKANGGGTASAKRARAFGVRAALAYYHSLFCGKMCLISACRAGYFPWPEFCLRHSGF